MTKNEYINYPSWMKSNINRCSCGTVSVIFYDEDRNYHVECMKCGKVFEVNTFSLKDAKDKWNNRIKQNLRI